MSTLIRTPPALDALVQAVAQWERALDAYDECMASRRFHVRSVNIARIKEGEDAIRVAMGRLRSPETCPRIMHGGSAGFTTDCGEPLPCRWHDVNALESSASSTLASDGAE